jgi:predicted nucleotidyltransferase
MLTKKEKDIIIHCAKKYNVLSIFLFGSSMERKTRANDIDLAVKGIKPELFFSFYAELFKQLPKPVDLVDLDEADSYFARRILEGGKVIYEV